VACGKLNVQTHRNWLDLLRLFFATLVLLGHSYWLIDHSQQRDPLYRLFGTVDCGTFAVCGFFVLSGYLIASAWDRLPDFAVYLRNRVLRIVPGFAVAFLLSVLLAGALATSDPAAYYGSLDWRRLALDLATLGPPGARFPTIDRMPIDGPMWTIRLEVCCYLIAPFVLPRRWAVYGLWVICAVLAVWHPYTHMAIGVSLPRFLLMFLSGAIYWRLRINPDLKVLVGSAVALPLALLFPQTWALGLATFGALLLLTLGRRPSPLRLPDISYGVYLYGWPVQNLLIIWGLGNPLLVFPASLAISCVLGAASWFGVERSALWLKRRAPVGGLAAKTRSSESLAV
jgi:peptidoglycan/LPS O-acetylase OafA/YrhL